MVRKKKNDPVLAVTLESKQYGNRFRCLKKSKLKRILTKSQLPYIFTESMVNILGEEVIITLKVDILQ